MPRRMAGRSTAREIGRPQPADSQREVKIVGADRNRRFGSGGRKGKHSPFLPPTGGEREGAGRSRGKGRHRSGKQGRPHYPVALPFTPPPNSPQAQPSPSSTSRTGLRAIL